MAKSSETFNKKENEKKRLKKKKDKEQKKEDRKANEGKAKSFDDMIAYVDENGNLTSTPPDPSKKRVVNIEEIQIGVAKKEEQEAEDLLRKGTVSFFNTSKGYGFIKDHVSQESIFVHINGLVDSIKENDKVTFTTEQTPKGKSAVDVKLA
ncbi:MAG TPA: cold shock domain-containing protein [Flavobacteriales bacterium]|nr:cold shock domain-containing protein [Flavobacteriales bacterium]